ncbi:MAG: FAD-dependent oxidoreductase [Mycobacterium pseudokansasii]|uniref:FAD-dependent oxidoreductase n=1 Tax=Mycobacterium pseudokansasii TaxID=2341080 RepID=UPI0023F446F8|nr:FAD-dependent oxidoreductase [Mycobacterium pseudokansasii]MBY0386911.1 FAD-dependent oxidoreductase [Mycobacterium pseudokansasii]
MTLISSTDQVVERVRLHEQAAGGRTPATPLAEQITGRAIELIVAHVTAIDPDQRTVHLDDGRQIGYDTLAYARGSHTDMRSPGVARYTYTAERAAELARRLSAGTGTIAVVGGGLTGIETAAELAESATGWQVALVTGGVVAPGLGSRGRRHVQRALARLGVRVYG